MIHAAFLLAAAVAAPVSPPPRPPDATYSYTLQQGGIALGSSTVVIDGSAPGTIVVKESASMSVPHYTATTTMRYDAATLHQTGYTADTVVAGATQHAAVTVKPGTMTLTPPNGTSIDIPADPAAPLELIGDNLVGGYVMLPAILHATGAKTFTLAVLSTGKPLVCKVVSDPLPSRPAFAPATDVELALELAGIRFIYWYDPATYVVHDVAIPAQQARLPPHGDDGARRGRRRRPPHRRPARCRRPRRISRAATCTSPRPTAPYSPAP